MVGWRVGSITEWIVVSAQTIYNVAKSKVRVMVHTVMSLKLCTSMLSFKPIAFHYSFGSII